MRKLLAVLVAAALAVACASNPKPEATYFWVDVAQRLALSTVQLRTVENEGYCSGFVIDNINDFVMTDEHCVSSQWAVDGGIVVDGIQAKVVFADETLDAAVLYVPGIDRPALQPNIAPLRVGEPVAIYGFAYGEKQALFRAGHVSAVDYEISGWRVGILWDVLDQTSIGGMSGGPIVNRRGEVVGQCQRGNDNISINRTLRAVHPATAKYWEHAAAQSN